MEAEGNPDKKRVRINISIDVQTRRRFRQFMLNRAFKNEFEAFKALLDIAELKEPNPLEHQY